MFQDILVFTVVAIATVFVVKKLAKKRNCTCCQIKDRKDSCHCDCLLFRK